MIAVWFSNGAASAVALHETIRRFGVENVRAVNNPVAEEDEDNIRFQKDVSAWCGIEIEYATNPAFPSNACKDVWDKRRAMSFPTGAPCTMELKKRARQLWEIKHKPDFHVLGFTLEEKPRHERFVKYERSNVIPVLIDAGITKQDCFKIVLAAGIDLPRVYKAGYPNANCIGCVKATSATYWNHVRKMHPEVFQDRLKQSRELGCKLVRHKGRRMFLDELPVEATGRPLKNTGVECGIFCEEKE